MRLPEIRNSISYVPGKEPQKENKILTVRRAPEITYSFASQIWEQMNKRMNEVLDRRNVQVVVIPNHDDVTKPLLHSLEENAIGPYGVASTHKTEWPDHEIDFTVLNASPDAESVYIVASPLSSVDYADIRTVADHYKNTLNAKCVTVVLTTVGGGRQDKNVNKAGKLTNQALNIRTEMQSMAPFVDRIMAVEPHSSASQAYAAQAGIPFAPLSPWKTLIQEPLEHGVLVPGRKERVSLSKENVTVVRPDAGRNIAAVRISHHTGFDSVSFDKERLSASKVNVSLSPEEQKKVEGKIGIGYDDEYSTGGTLNEILNACREYGMLGFAFMVVNGKLVPGSYNSKGEYEEGAEERLKHPLLSTLYLTDSREPVGKFDTNGKTTKISLAPFVREIIEADIQGINFWEEPTYRDMIIQEPDNLP